MPKFVSYYVPDDLVATFIHAARSAGHTHPNAFARAVMERALRGGGSLAPSVGAGGYVTTAAERTVLFAMIQGAQTVKAVCEQTGNWATTVSSTVRHLFEKGWISKLSDPVRTKGRSAAGYAVTEAGRAIYARDEELQQRMRDDSAKRGGSVHAAIMAGEELPKPAERNILLEIRPDLVGTLEGEWLTEAIKALRATPGMTDDERDTALDATHKELRFFHHAESGCTDVDAAWRTHIEALKAKGWTYYMPAPDDEAAP